MKSITSMSLFQICSRNRLLSFFCASLLTLLPTESSAAVPRVTSQKDQSPQASPTKTPQKTPPSDTKKPEKQQPGSKETDQDKKNNKPEINKTKDAQQEDEAAEFELNTLTTMNSKGKFFRLGIDPPTLKKFNSGKNFSLKETSTTGELSLLLQYLYCIPVFTNQDISNWIQSDVSLTEIAQSPKKFQADIFSFTGAVTKCVEIKMPRHLAARFSDQKLLNKFYRCEVTSDQFSGKIILYCLSTPKAWRGKVELNERVRADLFFIKQGASENNKPTLIFGVNRLAWHPNTLLGNAKMDVGLLDTVSNIGGLTERDSDCFYHLLKTMSNFDQKKLFSTAKTFENNYQFIEHFLKKKDPAKKIIIDPRKGELAWVKGTVLQVEKIAINDPFYQKYYGFKHYYQVDMIVHHKPFKVVEKDKKTKTYNSYPVVLCVRELPEGIPVGERVSVVVETPAFFLKIWQTETEYAKLHYDTPNENTLVFIARGLRRVDKEESSSKLIIGVITAGLFLLILAGLFIGTWIWGRGDRKFHQEVFDNNYTLKEGESLNEMGLNAQDKPDFSNLD